MKHRCIAFYLPQFHPVPENDAWWGTGFTEWTNVAKAKPLFRGHYQPHLPADLGFYDLRLSAVREAQAAMAKDCGIHGFCYYHYWFNGKRILERPFQEVFESGKPDFPFMLCWANENWTRAWDGRQQDVLLEQRYSETDDVTHINALIPYLQDPRYIRVNGKPVIAIYASQLLPDPARTVATWRDTAAKHGIGLYLCRVESHQTGGAQYLQAGFDAAIEFQPWGATMQPYHEQRIRARKKKYQNSVKDIIYRKCISRVNLNQYTAYKEALHKKIYEDYRFDYAEYVDYVKGLAPVAYKRFPCVMPMWDNSARRSENPAIFTDASPAKYQEWLTHVLNTFKPETDEENLVFLNAWNEWGEGNHIEPCQKWQHQYLDATRSALLAG